jgi:hypothetical protein
LRKKLKKVYNVGTITAQNVVEQGGIMTSGFEASVLIFLNAVHRKFGSILRVGLAE